MKRCAIIAAAGSGKRMGGVSKPNIELLGKTLFEYVLDAFEDSFVDEIVIVCSEDNEESLRQLATGYKKTIKFVRGGSERALSIQNGILSTDAEIICAHDCARPFITKEIIEKTILTAEKTGAACVCAPVTDTIKHIDESGIVHTPDRSRLFAVQTPQCFYKSQYLHAMRELGDDIIKYTDETSILEAIGMRVEYIQNADTNMKLTAIDDVPIAEILMKRRLEP